MSFPIEAGVNGGRLDEAIVTPRVKEYLKRTHDRPAYRRALEKGPKYAYGELSPVALRKVAAKNYAQVPSCEAPDCSAGIFIQKCFILSSNTLHSYQIPHTSNLTDRNEEQELYPPTPLRMRDCS